MNWFSRIFGNGVGRTVDSIGGLAKVVIGDKSAREAGYHAENMATKSQFASEFHYRGNRNWFDSLIDGFNRVPRPLIAFQVIFSPVVALYMIFKHPEEWTLLMQGLTLIPTGGWILYSTVVGFFFGGRMQIKAEHFKMNKKAMAEFRESYEEYMSDKEIANTPDTDQFEEHGDK